MPNVASILKQEIARIARKEAKAYFRSFPASVGALKKLLSAQKKKIFKLEAKLARLVKNTDSNEIALPKPAQLEKSRLGTKNIAKLRAKLDLTRAEMATLIGASANSIFLWENGKATPRAAAKAKIIALRGLGKREIKKLLAGMEKKEAVPAAEAKKGTKKRGRKPSRKLAGKKQNDVVVVSAVAPAKEEAKAAKKTSRKAPASQKGKNAAKDTPVSAGAPAVEATESK